MTVGDFFTSIMFLGFLIAPVFQIVAIGTQITEAIAGLERTREILNEKKEDDRSAPHRTHGAAIQGTVAFENVSFAYETGKQVLHGVSFRMPSREPSPRWSAHRARANPQSSA